MMRRFILTLLMGFCLVAYAAPQDTATMPWWTSPVMSDLVSPAQREKIRQIIRKYRNQLFDARNNAQKAQADVRDLLNEPTVNLAQAKPAIERLAQARAESTRLVTSMSVEIRGVLTEEQWRELLKRWSDVQRTHKNPETDVAP